MRHRRVCKRKDRTRESWRAEFLVGDEWQWRQLFPIADHRYRDPSAAGRDLEGAWRKVAAGGVPTERQAHARAEELARELARVADGLTLSALIRIEKGGPGKSRDRSPATRNSITAALDRFESFLDRRYPRLPLMSLRGGHVAEYLAERRTGGVSEATAARDLAYIRRMFQSAVERGDLQTNPCAHLRIRQPSTSETREATRKYVRTPEELARLLAACRDPFPVDATHRRGGHRKPILYEMDPPAFLYPFVLALLSTGCRRGELLEVRVRDRETKTVVTLPGLAWSDIDWAGRRIHVTGKTGPRVVPMPEELAEALREYRSHLDDESIPIPASGTVFLDDDGRPVHAPYVAFRSACARAGLPAMRLHDLRHCALTELARSGLPNSMIQKIAGHSTPVLTARYISHDDDETIARALEVRRPLRRHDSGEQESDDATG